MQHYLIVITMCFLYALFNVSGAALIKLELPLHQLNGVAGYVRFLMTWRVICGFAIIGMSALIMFKALSLGKFSYVIPVATGINFSLTVLLGILLFKDKLSLISVVGLGLILLGIITMSVGSS
ncbi:hypothetical protein GF339_10270 [candidate division KSB3 bacterium]|uniref:EamA domain-containing protein n=1 Tax=candidate division KSB3 bacterium TaxID=2044937 RepID=A0A9D5Q5T3_9BACT|nr:hypothetical protein [candidate division KSB3 bacterium]MBD3324960.1 hypothetical protein [candidate division KSB3 bacterium]